MTERFNTKLWDKRKEQKHSRLETEQDLWVLMDRRSIGTLLSFLLGQLRGRGQRSGVGRYRMQCAVSPSRHKQSECLFSSTLRPRFRRKCFQPLSGQDPSGRSDETTTGSFSLQIVSAWTGAESQWSHDLHKVNSLTQSSWSQLL